MAYNINYLNNLHISKTTEVKSDIEGYANNIFNNSDYPLITNNNLTLSNNYFTQTYTGTINYNGSYKNTPLVFNNNSVSANLTPFNNISNNNTNNFILTEENKDNFSYILKNIPMTLDYIGNVGGNNSAIKLSNNTIAIAYRATTNQDLRYIRSLDSEGKIWTNPIFLDTGGNVGSVPSIYLVNGNPAVAYYDTTNSTLKYIRANDSLGNTWATPITIQPMGDLANNVSFFGISLNVINGNPAIAYIFGNSATQKQLRYTYSSTVNGTNIADWSIPITIDGTGSATDNMGQFLSLQVLSNGQPAIAYLSRNNNTTSNDILKYAFSNNYGIVWSNLVIDNNGGTGGVGSYCRMIIVNGNPAIAYKNLNIGSDNIRYVRASTSTGNVVGNWNNIITITSPTYNQFGYSLSLNIVNNKPAIACYSSILGRVEVNASYISSNDINGNTWGTDYIVDYTTFYSGVAVSSFSLLDINNKPAVIYYHSINGGQLRYAYSGDITLSYSVIGK